MALQPAAEKDCVNQRGQGKIVRFRACFNRSRTGRLAPRPAGLLQLLVETRCYARTALASLPLRRKAWLAGTRPAITFNRIASALARLGVHFHCVLLGTGRA
jgi:hypothetical protein